MCVVPVFYVVFFKELLVFKKPLAPFTCIIRKEYLALVNKVYTYTYTSIYITKNYEIYYKVIQFLIFCDFKIIFYAFFAILSKFNTTIIGILYAIFICISFYDCTQAVSVLISKNTNLYKLVYT